ncbi:MAG: ferredoxin [Actinomycetota bacterium]|jgi:ferredoxin|nr:ferredoxin [Actinomycetota bacterium]
MKVRVDATNCQAFGTCRDVAPELFTLDEWGYASATGDGEVPVEQREAALRAVRECPAQAVHADEA